MDDVKGILCSTCTAAFRGNTRRARKGSSFRCHHVDYASFVASKSLGCCICNWLWLAHTPPPESDSGNGNDTTAPKNFRIICKVYAHNRVTQKIFFIIRCDWAKTHQTFGTFA